MFIYRNYFSLIFIFNKKIDIIFTYRLNCIKNIDWLYNQQDPDDENAPLQPDSFIINFANGIGEGSAKATEATEREGEEDKPDVISLYFLI